jgi:ubiquinone/menaquinone biosynthesis C-methylase UbiE
METAEQHPIQGSSKHTYIVDPESAAEMGRLLLQDRAVNEVTGGPLTERSDQASIHEVLDIGCGPGGWVINMARTYPHMKITGIDISQLMIAFAQTEATREGLANTQFEIMNALEPLRFPDNYFDLVNIRFAVGYIRREHWPLVMRECFRVTRPGGTLRLTETDHTGITNSAAYGKVHNLISGMLHKAGYGFSEDGSTYCLTPMLEQLLTDAGYTAAQNQPFMISISHGTSMLSAHWQNLRTILTTAGPILEKLGLTTQDEAQRARMAVEEDMRKEKFRGAIYLLTTWGQKMAASSEL